MNEGDFIITMARPRCFKSSHTTCHGSFCWCVIVPVIIRNKNACQWQQDQFQTKPHHVTSFANNVPNLLSNSWVIVVWYVIIISTAIFQGNNKIWHSSWRATFKFTSIETGTKSDGRIMELYNNFKKVLFTSSTTMSSLYWGPCNIRFC